MQPQQEGEKTKFSRREWLLVTALLLVIEYWIFSTAFTFANEQSVLNYISFAGTIASILLAIIAIIYSFVQSESQLRSSGAISAQIESMRGESSRLAEQRTKLEGQLNRVDAIASKLDAVDTNVAESRKDIKTIQEALAASSVKKMVPDADVPASLDKKYLARRLLRTTTFDADLLCIFLAKLSKLDYQKLNIYEALNTHYALPMETASRAAGALKNWTYYYGVGNQILITLRSFGLLEWKDAKIKLEPELLELLPTLDAEVRKASDGPGSGTLKPGIERIDASFSAQTG